MEVNTLSSRLLAPYCLLFLPTLNSFPNCMATSQTQRHCYTSRTPCSVPKKHFLPAAAGFACYQASKSQLHKLIALVFLISLPVAGPSLQTIVRKHSQVTTASKRRCSAGALLRSRPKKELNSHEAPKTSHISLSLRHKCLENQPLLVLLIKETPSLPMVQILKDPA